MKKAILLLALAACIVEPTESAVVQGLCVDGDSQCCIAHPSSASCVQARAFDAVDTWGASNGISTTDKMCKMDGTGCATVIVQNITLGTISCRIVTVWVDGQPVSTTATCQ